jgi:hypothetical protein
VTAFTPEWRVRVNGYTVTDATLVNLQITSGRQTIYEQPAASYTTFSLITEPSSSVPYQINDPVTIEVKDTSGNYVVLFGGFLTDVSIYVTTAGTIQTAQEVRMVAVGALARLVRANFTGNLSSDMDGDQIYALLSTVLLADWQEVPGALTWENYDPVITWENAGNTGLGEIDQPGDYELESQNNLNGSVYDIAAGVATSGLGYLYEDSQGRIGYADSTRRSQYLSANGYVDLDARQAVGSGLEIIKRAGDVRNKISIVYGSSGNASVTDQDDASISLYGELASTITTTIKGQTDAEDQAAFYLSIRAYPQFEFRSITFPLGNPEMDDTDRDALLNVFMGQPVNIQNLPANMTNGEYQGFVEGWTWRAGVKGLSLELIVSPVAFSLQAFRWNSVPANETWNTISPTLDWLNATIVA